MSFNMIVDLNYASIFDEQKIRLNIFYH